MTAVSAPRGIPSLDDLAREYRAQLTAAARAAYTNEDLIAMWYKAREAEVCAETLRGLRSKSKHLRAFLAEKGLHVLDVDREQANRYVQWLKTAKYPGRKVGTLSPRSTVAHLKAASSVYEWLSHERGLTLNNPFSTAVRLYKRKHRAELRSQLRALDENETALQLEGAETLDDFLVVLLPFKTLARADECAGILMERINWQERTILLDPHPKRTHLKLYFDEELEFFLRLKCERNRRDYPGNPYLWPSPRRAGGHLGAANLLKQLKAVTNRSPLAPTMKDKNSNITMHTARRSGTSVLKRRRPTAPSGVPSHIVAVLRGDTLEARSENVEDPTQGIYTRLGKVEGVDEVRWWYDRGMPSVGALAIWHKRFPTLGTAVDVAGLINAARARLA